MLILPFLASLAGTVDQLLTKIVLSRWKLSVRNFNVAIFIFLFLFTAALAPLFWHIDWALARTPLYLVLFAGLIVCAVGWNHAFFTGMKQERIQEVEAFFLLRPLITVIFAALIFPSERAFEPLMAAIIGGGALIFAHVRRHHLRLSAGDWWLVGGVLLMSAEALFVKQLLTIASPVSLYFWRTLFVTLCFFIIYRPVLQAVTPQQAKFVYLAALFAEAFVLLAYWSYALNGVVLTSLILLLEPILIYLGGVWWLKERLRPATTAATAIILLAIVYTILR